MASDLTPERVRALLEEATPGPWRWAHHGTHEVEAAPNQRIADCGTIGHDYDPATGWLRGKWRVHAWSRYQRPDCVPGTGAR